MSKTKVKEGVRVEECPKCGSRARQVWSKGRTLTSECTGHLDSGDSCFWRGEPYTPPKKAVQTTKFVDVDQFGGFVYEAFDQFGQTTCHSQTYRNRADCLKAAQAEVDRWSTVEGYGQCSAVVWPAKVKVRGSLVKPSKRKK